jgi:hypothetical protein
MHAHRKDTFVLAILEAEARHLVIRGESDVAVINAALPLLTNPAALAEATKLRDFVIKIRDIYLPLASKK